MRPRHVNQRGKPISRPISLYDKWLIGVVIGLVIIGLMMVASSSVNDLNQIFSSTLFIFNLCQACYLFAGFVLALFVIRTDSSFWERISMPMLIVCLFIVDCFGSRN